MRLSDKKKIALVLSGGGVKAAAFHIGVCLALREKGFHFSGGLKSENSKADQGAASKPLTFSIYVGSSAGSVVAAFLAAGHSLDDIIDAFTRGAGLGPIRAARTEKSKLRPISYRDIFSLNLKAGRPSSLLAKIFGSKKPSVSGGFEVLLKQGFKVNGLFTTKNIEKYIRTVVFPENDFKLLDPELYVIATQLNHSRKAIFGPYSENSKDKDTKYSGNAKVSEAVAASASLPPFFAPYPIRNAKGKEIYYFDGEIRDTLSTHVAADHGADLVISSYSIQPYHFNEQMGSLHEYGMPIIFNQALYQLVQQKIEKHIKHQQNMGAMIKSVQGYMKEAGIAEEHITKLTDILTTRTNFNPKVDYLYIHPAPQDFEFFFADHFSLNEKVLSGIVRTGFKSTMNVLRTQNL